MGDHNTDNRYRDLIRRETVNLAGVHIIVADDQTDVAKTLTEPLKTAGASLQFATDGEQALQLVRAGGHDLLIVDMKMPPGDWGGLWLLKELQRVGIEMPALVLSGEGQRRQAVEALRCGATDWIDKADAHSELLMRCRQHMDLALDRAVEAVATGGPSPLAHAYARYQRSIGGDLQYNEALRLLEEIVRFVTLIGLAESNLRHYGQLSKVQPVSMARPTLGTWLSVIGELSRKDGAGQLFISLTRDLMPRGDKQFRGIAELRNNLHHGGADPSRSDKESVFRLTEFCAHRLSLNPFTLGSHAQMRYVDDKLEIKIREYRGALPPRTTELILTEPEFLASPEPYLFVSGEKPVRLSPWFCVLDSDERTGSSLAVFDGVKARKPNRISDDDVLLYTDPATAERRKQRHDRLTTWTEVAEWFVTEKA